MENLTVASLRLGAIGGAGFGLQQEEEEEDEESKGVEMLEVETAAAALQQQQRSSGKLSATSLPAPLERVPSSSSYTPMTKVEGLGLAYKDAVNIWHLSNIALPLSYFSVGFALAFVDTPLKVYVVKELDAGAEALQILKTVRVLPWTFKIVAGLLTDCVPIMGMRRKPYFLIGWLIYFLANGSLALAQQPGLTHLLACCFLSSLGYVLADVAADSILVERSRLESTAKSCSMVAVVVIARHLGSFLGQILGTIVFNKVKWGWGMTIGQVFTTQALLPICILLPFVYSLRDPKTFVTCRSLLVQFQSLWTLVRRRTVWEPMAFVAWYYLLHVPNASWEPFLMKGLGFTAFQMGLLSTVGAFCSFAGCAVYNTFMTGFSWRTVYIITSTIGTIFAALQLILAFRLNVRWQIHDLWFSLGDEVIHDFIMAVHFIPLINVLLILCPLGAEGSSFALITTLGNVARAAASNVGARMVHIWDVSNKTLKHQHFEGVWKLTLLTATLQLVGLLPVRLFPHGREHMARKPEHVDFWGGVGLLTFLVAAWTWTITVSIIGGEGQHH